MITNPYYKDKLISDETQKENLRNLLIQEAMGCNSRAKEEGTKTSTKTQQNSMFNIAIINDYK